MIDKAAQPSKTMRKPEEPSLPARQGGEDDAQAHLPAARVRLEPGEAASRSSDDCCQALQLAVSIIGDEWIQAKEHARPASYFRFDLSAWRWTDLSSREARAEAEAERKKRLWTRLTCTRTLVTLPRPSHDAHISKMKYLSTRGGEERLSFEEVNTAVAVASGDES